MTIRKTCIAIGTATLCLASATTVSAAASFTGNFGGLAVGQTTPLEKGHVFWSGAFSGAFFDTRGDGPVHDAFVNCPGTNDLDFNANTSHLAGYCIIMGGAEDRIFLNWSCAGTPGNCEGTSTWTGGTGKWRGMTANATFSALLGPALTDGSIPTLAVWHVDYNLPVDAAAFPYGMRQQPATQRAPAIRLVSPWGNG